MANYKVCFVYYCNTVDVERFTGLNIRGFSPMIFFAEILSRCIGYQCSLLTYRAAVWIGYYRLFPDIIGYFRIVLKFMSFRVAIMYENNGTFYGGTKI